MKKILIILFMTLLIGLMSLNLFTADQALSLEERRHLKKFPDLNLETVMNGNFMKEMDEYLLDHFVFRENFRNLKGFIETKILMKNDVNDYFISEGHIGKNEYPYKPEMVDYFVDYITKIQKMYLKDQSVYLSIIPDKNYYMEAGLKLDYDDMIERLQYLNLTYIDLFDTLTLDDYFTTDPHWRQEKLDGVLNKLNDVMSFNPQSITEYYKEEFKNFHGAYYGQSAQKFDSETLYFLSLDLFNNVEVKNYEKINEKHYVYSRDDLLGMDPYDVYLGGASPLMTLKNPNATSDKEIIIFRDSFGSSLSPLLIASYETITLVDTRYIGFEYLDEFIDFKDQDILFLYSTLVVNNSIMLK